MTLKVRIKNAPQKTKHGEAIFYLPLDASGTKCTDLILVVISFYIETI